MKTKGTIVIITLSLIYFLSLYFNNDEVLASRDTIASVPPIIKTAKSANSKMLIQEQSNSTELNCGTIDNIYLIPKYKEWAFKMFNHKLDNQSFFDILFF